MKRVVTLTLNPAIDVSTAVGHVAANQKLRCDIPQYQPGGGGINVSVALARLGCDSTAVFPCGGPPGEIMRKLLTEHGIDHQVVEINGWTRMNLAVRDQSSDEQYRFLMPGPPMSQEEVRSCLDRLDSCDPMPDYMVFSGSLPPGVGPDVIRDLSALARRHEIRLCIDTSGEALHEAARQGVFLLKPNLRELGDITRVDTSTEEQQEKALQTLVAEGNCEVVVLSLGGGGVLMASSNHLERFRAPTVPIKSRVGAGDSMMAGMIAGWCKGLSIRDAIRLGVAAGSAAVMTPGTELCRKEDAERLYNEIEQS